MELNEELINHIRSISNNNRYSLSTRIRILEDVRSETSTIVDMLRYEQELQNRTGTLFETNHD